ncbi:hypothetical protein CB1_000153018 [Camelus ferus]|nr:hypothetical protein CB1_000153018 [Camelus ferus]
MAIMSVSFVVGIVVNGLVLWMTVFRLAHTVTTMWFFNLALANATGTLKECFYCYFKFDIDNKGEENSQDWKPIVWGRQVTKTVIRFLLGFLVPLAIIGTCAHLICTRLRTIQPTEDPSETWQPSPAGALCPLGAALFLLYSLAPLTSSLLEAVSYSLVIQVAGPLLPSPLSVTWFGQQTLTDAAFTILLPLTLTWTHSGWPLGDTFCHPDPGLAFLTF